MSETRGGNGGDAQFLAGGKDITFQPGLGAAGGFDGSFIFCDARGQELLRIGPDGAFLVRGAPAANDLEVYEGFRAWLIAARVRLGRGAEGGEGGK